MRCLVTGVAGFIGSTLAEKLLSEGHAVTGIDCFTGYYPRILKERNLSTFRHNPAFRLLEVDLSTGELASAVQDTQVIFHLAAQPGVRRSWGVNFEDYVKHNVLATQRLLEAATKAGILNFVYSSSSSIYGDAESLPTREDTTPRPVSPYGVSKLAGENLCQAYRVSLDVPVTILRYFTVYGPRQRPEMAFNIFIDSIDKGKEVTILGDGNQSRDFTYVDDIVGATVKAVGAECVGSVINVGSGSPVSLNLALGIIEDLVGKKAKVRYEEHASGDVRHTSADMTRAKKILGFQPKIRLREGLAEQVRWQLA